LEDKDEKADALNYFDPGNCSTVTGFALMGRPMIKALRARQIRRTVTVKGKIAYMKALGGYFVNGEDLANS
jgi:hypothetical protein